jgi:hypothetical protein
MWAVHSIYAGSIVFDTEVTHQVLRRILILKWGLPVLFQHVVPEKRIAHSSNTGEADGADQSASKESIEWTFTRMPDLPFVVERL